AICAPARAAHVAKAVDSTGALVGHVYDAQKGAPAASSLVAVVWPVLFLDAHGVHRESRQLQARANDDGWFAICGLDPGDYQLRAENGARNTGFIDAVVRPRDIARLSLVLGADSPGAPADTAAHGSARLAGTVTTHDGHPLEGAQVVVDGSPLTAATDARGAFALEGVPDGSRMVEARALGYAPTRVAVAPSRDQPSTVAIVMEKRVETLQTVTVFGKESRRMRDLSGFSERSTRGFGRFLTRAQIDRADVQDVCDLLRRVPGVSVSPDAGMGCGASVRGVGSPNRCEPTVYLDNMPFGGSVAEFTRSISPRDIMGIEIYSTATEPPQYPGACGSIVAWTR
ncbi:MAG TPA: carboxypeptidase regulatory-like domain-containing protein, partial [Gemmatimonadaceae bacterium]|nr:carboxypeptidase regulatory-like domain-containing protein [Gemmatimonadaceae bacterium]